MAEPAAEDRAATVARLEAALTAVTAERDHYRQCYEQLREAYAKLAGPAIGQYLAAFDFCVSGAGYEAFHEIVSHALPAILVASAHAAGDEAATRAKFAEKAGLALCLDEARLDQLPQMVTVLSNEKARAHLRENCRMFRRDNGAAQAAHALETLVDG